MDRIFIENLRIVGVHGVYEQERRVEQEFLIDISAECETQQSGVSDKLQDTVDYGVFRDIAREVVEGTSRYLVEKLAHDIASRILKDGRVQSVTVTIRKPAVFPSGVPGVTVTKRRT